MKTHLDTQHKAGSYRSDFARAKIGLLEIICFEDIPDDKVYSTSGYWDKLMCYGPVSHDAAAMLRQYLTPEHARALDDLLQQSDRGEI